jgi:hypothetical protein
MKEIFGAIVIVCAVFVSVYVSWWSCGERFPNAQFACFVTNK